MRAADPALLAYLAEMRARADKRLLMADCFTFTLLSGLILAYTDADVPIALNGTTYRADSVLVDGLRYRCTTGLDVDQQRITVSALGLASQAATRSDDFGLASDPYPNFLDLGLASS